MGVPLVFPKNQKTLLELSPVDDGKRSPQRIVRGYPVFQVKILGQPSLLGLCKIADGHPIIGTAQDATNGDKNDINQRVVNFSY
jgi:hypothetical protein